jgi:uncharacterized membrane protein (DUF485 family)
MSHVPQASAAGASGFVLRRWLWSHEPHGRSDAGMGRRGLSGVPLGAGKSGESCMEHQAYARVRSHPKFVELVERRSRYAWTLSIAMLAIYYGFIMVVAFAPELLGVPLADGAVMTVGIPVGILIILAAFVLTGLYVRRANSEFDALTQEILEASK